MFDTKEQHATCIVSRPQPGREPETTIDTLEHLSEDEILNEASETLITYDVEAEQLLIDLYGPWHTQLEAYECATLETRRPLSTSQNRPS